jgi:hypothetical protein
VGSDLLATVVYVCMDFLRADVCINDDMIRRSKGPIEFQSRRGVSATYLRWSLVNSSVEAAIPEVLLTLYKTHTDVTMINVLRAFITTLPVIGHLFGTERYDHSLRFGHSRQGDSPANW